jgi:lipopolysaccharide transport system ATP-binding protein
MNDIAIRCEGLAKQYRIGERESYRAIRDVIANSLASPLRRLGSALRHSPNGSVSREKPNIWALTGVSFEIKRGEVVGIIGRNGAGKSTLLKILSRITEPTHGHADIWGRVGSLLEVGTGFHPELTGRDNIFLNGAILGMRRAEIARKFDEIVAFAEVERFIDTPVKRYSSGMYVRLAFAVASHMETEILLVDEVLAVGDAQFQKKCFEKFRQISTGGRAILFVSHNMAALRTACQNGIILDRGGVVGKGEINAIADRYLTTLSTNRGDESIETKTFILGDVSISSNEGTVIKTFDTVEIRTRILAKTEVQNPGMFVSILTLDNQRVAALAFNDFLKIKGLMAGEWCELGFRIERFPLLAGEYQIEIDLTDLDHHKIELVNKKYLFEVVESPVYQGRKIDRWFGLVGLQAQAFGGPVAAEAGDTIVTIPR